MIDAPATRVVHCVYRWGVVTEDWIRMQVAPAPGLDVSVLAARRTGEAEPPTEVPVRAIGDGARRLADEHGRSGNRPVDRAALGLAVCPTPAARSDGRRSCAFR